VLGLQMTICLLVVFIFVINISFVTKSFNFYTKLIIFFQKTSILKKNVDYDWTRTNDTR
jgi:hypothetical protein